MSAAPPPAFGQRQPPAPKGASSAGQGARSRSISPTLDANAPAFLPSSASAAVAAAHAVAAAARVSGSGKALVNSSVPVTNASAQPYSTNEVSMPNYPPAALPVGYDMSGMGGGGPTMSQAHIQAPAAPLSAGQPQMEQRPPRPPATIAVTREHVESYGPPGDGTGAGGGMPTTSSFHSQRERRHSGASYSSQGGVIPPTSVGAPGGGEPGGGGGGTDANPSSLNHMVDFINHHKLAGSRPIYSFPGGPSEAPGGRAAHMRGGLHHPQERDPKWVQPSGPRRPGEGVENEEQGIVNAEKTPQGMVLRITLLAAGFVIGPSGSSVREIMRVTGADIKSWTENRTAQQMLTGGGGGGGGPGGGRRPCRMVVVEGEEAAVLQAVNVVVAAVDRYKDLCEGRYQGQSVPRQQRVLGVDFCYQPPPRSVVPCAAALKGQTERALHGSGRSSRDDYNYSPPGGNGLTVGAPYTMPSYHPPAAYAQLAADPYGGAAPYMLATAMPPSPVRGGPMDMTFAPLRFTTAYDPAGAAGTSPQLYGNRMTSGGSTSGSTSAGGAGGGHSSGGATATTTGVSGKMSASTSSGGASYGGASLNSSTGGATVGMMSYMPMSPMGPMAPLDPSLGMGPLPLPPGSPPMTLIPGALNLPPGTDMAALTDYMMKTGGFLAPGGLLPLDMTSLGGGVGAASGFVPMDLQAAFMAGMAAAQPGGFITGLPGFYYGAPLPAAPLSPAASGVISGSPTRGGARMTSASSGGAGMALPPPSPSRLNPLAQPWAAPFMARDPHTASMMAGMVMAAGGAGGGGGGGSMPVSAAGARMNGGAGVDSGYVTSTPGGHHGSMQPLGGAGGCNTGGGAHSVSPGSAPASTPGVGDEDDELANSAGEEVALAAAERALANRTPKRPVKVSHVTDQQSTLPPLGGARGPSASGGGESGSGNSDDRRDTDGGGSPLDPLSAVHGSPTGGLVSAGDPLVSPTRFSTGAKSRGGSARGLRSRSYPDSPTHAAHPAGPSSGGGPTAQGTSISSTLAALPNYYTTPQQQEPQTLKHQQKTRYGGLDESSPDVAARRDASPQTPSMPVTGAMGGRGVHMPISMPVPVPASAEATAAVRVAGLQSA